MDTQQVIQEINRGRAVDIATIRRELDIRFQSVKEATDRIEEQNRTLAGALRAHDGRIKKLEETKFRGAGAGWAFGVLLLLLEAWYHVAKAVGR